MKLHRSQSLLSKGLSASVGASLLCFGSAAANAQSSVLPHNGHASNDLQAMRHDLTGLQAVSRDRHTRVHPSLAAHGTVSPSIVNSAAIILPGQVSPFRTSRPHNLASTLRLGKTTYVNDLGNQKDLSKGVSLDLGSQVANIQVGTGLLTGSVTISEGGVNREIKAGSNVTAAEYAAVTEKLATGDQGLSLDKNGVANGGNLNLNLVSNDGATIRATQLVVPTKVTVTGDFARSADGIRVTNDLINYGTVNAVSSDANPHSAIIAARDIHNETTGLISSESSSNLALSLRADRDLTNDGAIRSSGDLELSAGRSLTNNAIVHAQGNVVLDSQAVTNHGSVTSTENNVTVTNSAGSSLLFDNTSGTVSAANGAINIRTSDYVGTANTTVYGGDLLSQQLNVNAGQGTANLTVNQLTGTVNTTGLAAHVSANTADLVLGTQCLTGDPTYYNTGNIILGGSITVQENLAIIAGGNITTNQTGLNITARNSGTGQGFDIVIVAGANVTSGSGLTPGTLPSQPPITGNTTAPVSFSTNSTTGGNIDLTGSTGGVIIDAGSTNSNLNAGNVTLAAFSSGGKNGQILMNSSSTIFASGNGSGNNGNVNIIAGATTGNAIQVGNIDNLSGSGLAAGTGNVVISNAQPTTSNSSAITFGTNGSITSGNSIVASSTVGGGNVTVGNLQSQQSVSILSGGTTVMGNLNNRYNLVQINSVGDLTVNTISNNNNNDGMVVLTSQGNITFNDTVRADNGILVVAGGNLITGSTGSPSIFGSKNGNGGNLSLIAGAAFQVNANNVTVTGASGTGGSILFTAGNQIQALGMSSNSNGSGGIVNLIAFNGVINLNPAIGLHADSNNSDNSNSHANGTINIIAGSNTTIAVQTGPLSAVGSPNSTGTVNVFGATPNATVANPVVLSTGSNFAGITTGSFLGGALTPLSGIVIGGGVDSVGGAISFGAGFNGVSFGRVGNFGEFDINSLGNITNHATLDASIDGAGDRANTILWTALGNISFSGDIKLHATGSGITSINGGGGIVMVAGGTVQTVVNDLGGFSEGAIEASSGLEGGNITVVAGANFTRNGNTLTINGSSGSGGSILFDGSAVGGFTGRATDHIDTHSQGSGHDGGDINLISYNDLQVATANYDASGNGTGINGIVTNVASGTITLPKIGMSASGGAVIVRAATPSTGTIDTAPGTAAFGTTTTGSFLSGTLTSTTQNFSAGVFSTGAVGVGLTISTASDIALGNLDVSSNLANVAGGNVLLQSGGNVSTGTINVSNTNANGDSGTIDITSKSSTQLNVGGGGTNGTGTLTANAGTTSGNGGTVNITNTGSGGILITTVPSETVTSGNGASIKLDAGSGNLNLTALGAAITRNGVGTNMKGGNILLSYGTLTAPAGAITLNANGTGTGAGGDISVQTTAALTIGSGSGQYIVSNSGAGGTLNFHAGGAFTLASTGSVNADNVLFTTDSGSITINKAITAVNVKISSGALTTITTSITADPITILSKQAVSLSGMTAPGGILVVSGSDITSTAGIGIFTGNNAGNGGNVVMIAGANYTDNGTTVTINSASGGNILLSTAGMQLNTGSFSSGGSGGNVTMLALENGAGTGKVNFDTTATIQTGGSGSGQNGTVVVIGDASSGTAVTIGAVNTTGGTGTASGDVTIAAATPNLAGVSPIQQSNASYTGSFTGGATKNGSINLTTTTTNGGADTSLTSGGSVTSTGVTTNGGNVTISSGAAGTVQVSGSGVNASGTGTANGGKIDVTVGTGGFGTTTAFNSTGGNSGVGGSGGMITITANTPTILNLPTIVDGGNGTSGSNGTVIVSNFGAGGIGINGANGFLTNGNGAGLTLTVNAAAGATAGPIQITGATTINGNGGTGFANGVINLTGSTIADVSGALTIQSTGGLAGTGAVDLTTTSGNVTATGSIALNAGGNISLNIAGGALSTAGSVGQPVTLTSGGTITGGASISTSSTGTNNTGAPIVINATGAATLGTLTSNGNGTGSGNFITVTASQVTTGAITSTGASGGAISLASTNNNISVTGPINTGGTGALNIALLGVTPGNAVIAPGSNVSKLTGSGGGLITFDSGANAIPIGGVGANQSLVITTSNAATGVNTATALSTTGSITFNTPLWTNSTNITAGQFTVQNLTGNLVITSVGGTITATNPPGGTPGNPSSPTAIVFETAEKGTLTLNGTMNFAGGDLSILNFFGTTTSSNGSLFASTKNILLDTAVWSQVGTGNITANNLIISLVSGGSIVNTTGDVNLTGNVTLNGHDFAVLAEGNINVGSNLTINLSTTSAGNLTMIAGYNFTPSSGGQIETGNPFTLGSAGTGNINGANLTINLSDSSAAGGTGGSLLAVASKGSVTLGSINTSSAHGTAGDVTIIGETGITTGAINASAPNGGGTVTLSVATPSVSGSPVITNGTLSGGSILAGDGTAGGLTVSSINAGQGSISLNTSGASSTMTVNGALTANQLTLNADVGTLNLTTTNTLTAQRDIANNGGSINITAGTVTTTPTGALTLDATGSGTGTGGTITYTNLSATPVTLSSSTLVLNAGSSTSGGTVVVSSGGDLTVQSGSLNAGGSNGAGAQIILTAGTSGIGKLTLTDTSFLTQVNGTGSAGDGGQLQLTGNGIVFTSSAASPLQITANGSGTGNGGFIFYTDNSTLQTFIGAPAKAPKGPANFVSFSAVSGNGGGDGGVAEVAVGGNLTANSSSITVNPQSSTGDWYGGTIQLSAGGKLAKGGTLVVNGNLAVNAVNNGLGGTLDLEVNSTKAFVLNPTKVPKNGVFGTLSATGNGGEIIVHNALGGITVSQSTAMTAPSVQLTTDGKGAIAEGKGAVISASTELELTSATASIGKKALLINTPLLTVSTQGSVNITDQFTGNTSFSQIAVGGSVTLNTNGATTLNSISTTKGSILVSSSATNGGLLQLEAGETIVANNGAVTLQNLDTTNGGILIGNGATVETAGKGKAVKITVGAPPNRGTNTTPPANINVTGAGGTAFFGPGGVSTTGTATVNLVNQDVIFNALGGRTIVLGNGVLIQADPPPPVGPHSSFVSDAPLAPSSMSMFTAPSSSQQTLNIAMPITVSQTPDVNAQLIGSISQLPGVNGQQLGSTEQLPGVNGQLGSIEQLPGLHGLQPGITSPLNGLLCISASADDAAVSICGGRAEISGQPDLTSNGLIVDATIQSEVGTHQIMNHGNVVFAPVADTTIQSAHGTVKLAAGSVTLLMQTNDGLAVYNFDDRHSGSVVVETHGKKFALSPGRHVLISNHKSEQFEEVNAIELVQYRGLSKAKLSDGAKIYTSEFSLPSAYFAVKPLKTLLSSKHPATSKTAKHMLKTSAIIMTLNPDRGDFVQFFKPKSMACAK